MCDSSEVFIFSLAQLSMEQLPIPNQGLIHNRLNSLTHALSDLNEAKPQAKIIPTTL